MLVSAAVVVVEEESLISSGALDIISNLAIATRGVSRYVIVAAVITVVILVVFIILRVCNIGALNWFIKGFLSIVSFISCGSIAVAYINTTRSNSILYD